MAAAIGKGLPPLKFDANKAKVTHEKQGIVTILGSDLSEQCKAPSLRRTLSADMSSKKWLSQNGMMKKVASSKALKDEEHKNPNNQIGSWSSILCGKINKEKVKEEDTILPPPYVHPLEKKSSNPLSEKSLEICTENLGSETGSDSFSSYASSESGDAEEENQKLKLSHSHPAHNNYCTSKRSRQVSFPPPIASLHVQSHREDGRLVLEVVSLPSQNCFQAQRQDGRLVLTLVNNEEHDEDEEYEKAIEDAETLVDGDEDEDGKTLDEVEGDEDVGSSKLLSGQVVEVDKSREILMNDLMGVDDEDEDEDDEVNQTEDHLNGPWRLFNKAVNHKKKVENIYNKGSFMMVPFLKGCKELRRSLVMLEPYCIASS